MLFAAAHQQQRITGNAYHSLAPGCTVYKGAVYIIIPGFGAQCLLKIEDFVQVQQLQIFVLHGHCYYERWM